VAKLSAARTRCYLDEFDISGSINSVDLGLKQVIIPVPCFGDIGPKKIVGNYDHNFKFTGFGDFVNDAFDEQVAVNFRTDEDHYLSTVFGTTEGSIGYDDLVRTMDEVRSGQVDGAQLLNLGGEGSGGRARATLLRVGSVTAGNGTGRNTGISTSPAVFRVIFRLLSFTGTSITMKLQGSSDDGAGDAYADIAGLTSGALTAPGVVVVTTTATLEAWKRVVCSGTFSAASVVVTAGVVAGSG
jgi:hypothetical protein